jgi:hypothetical protein
MYANSPMATSGISITASECSALLKASSARCRSSFVVDGYSKDRMLEMAQGRGVPIPITSVTSATGSLRLTGPTESGDRSIVRQRLIYLTRGS